MIDVEIYESTTSVIAVKIKINHFCHIFLSSIVPIVKGLSEDEKQIAGQEETPMDNRAYIDAVIAYADIVYRTALSYTKASHDAEDVTQTVFMKLLEAKDGFADDEHLRRWLIRVTVNECKNLWKSFWRRGVRLFDQTAEDEQKLYDFKGHTERGSRRGMPPEVPEFEDLLQSALYEAVMALPKDYRIVVHLFYYEDYSTREIAELLHIREQTVRTRLVRARKKLKQRLEEAWQDEE